MVPAENAADWISVLLDLPELTHETSAAVLQLGRKVNDRTRDIPEHVLRRAIAKLTSAGVSDQTASRPLEEYVVPDRAHVVRTFGETLPKGMELESSASCLSTVTALNS